MTNSLLSSDFHHLLFPAILFVFYLVFWLLVGRDPRIQTVAPQYGPPEGVSPGVSRYIRTGGSDGTTLAAVAASLAAQGIFQSCRCRSEYHLELLDSKRPVAPEEAALVKTLFNVILPAQPYAASATGIVGDPNPVVPGRSGETTITIRTNEDASQTETIFRDGVVAATSVARSVAVINPAESAVIARHLQAIQNTFQKNLQGVYFRQNFRYAGIGILSTFIWALATAPTLSGSSPIFLTFWLLMFTSISGLVIGGLWTSQPTRPTPRQRISKILVPLLFFGGPGALIYSLAPPANHGFILALLLSVLLNNVFFVIMRAPTEMGRAALEQLAGFREFLMRVEQDQLDRVNPPAQRAELMNHFLPYAIALGVQEGWGDTMAAALSDAIIER